jgi:acetate kinase
MNSLILTINAGSSSIRFAVYEALQEPKLRFDGKIDRIGTSGTSWVVNDPSGELVAPRGPNMDDHAAATSFLLDWLELQQCFSSIMAVGHRVVFGMKHSEPVLISSALLAEMRDTISFDPDHMPREMALIDALRKRYPNLNQVACFDTAFHHDMPPVAKRLPIPRRFESKGVQRYGFHGLSYAYLLEELGRIDPAAAKGRVVFAHLGNGASMAAVKHGNSVDTSMGFTPTSGLMMSTRTGDLDPGLIYYLARMEEVTVPRFNQMINHESGLLGVSESSPDMRDLLEKESRDPRAAEAVELFCYQAKKWIGAYAAVLGGLDSLIFAGGIGENAPPIRARICEGLSFLGIEIDEERNAGTADVISRDALPVTVRVIRTDEELMIARSVLRYCTANLS